MAYRLRVDPGEAALRIAGILMLAASATSECEILKRRFGFFISRDSPKPRSAGSRTRTLPFAVLAMSNFRCEVM